MTVTGTIILNLIFAVINLCCFCLSLYLDRKKNILEASLHIVMIAVGHTLSLYSDAVPSSVYPCLPSLVAQGQGLSGTILLSAPETKEKPNALLRKDPYGGGKARPSDRIIA